MILYNRKTEDTAPGNQPDPYMIKGSDGRFYMYATYGQIYSSDSLLDGWRYEGTGLRMPGQHTCWAPSVIELDGLFYMYYSSINDEITGDEEEHAQQMRVAVSESAKGPFEYKKTLLPPFSIDPHVVRTPSGLYMFYCNNVYEAERPGTRIFCDKMTDPFTLEGKPVCAVSPSLDEEIYMRDRFEKGKHWHTIEGAFYFHRENKHFLMYSGACYQNPTYFIGYCTAHGPEDVDLRKLDWKKYPDCETYRPLIRGNDLVEGTGHNSVIFDEDKCYIVYHGRNRNSPKTDEDSRIAQIDEMRINDGRLYVSRIPEKEKDRQEPDF